MKRTKIHFSWTGKTDAEEGEAKLTVGENSVTVPMASFKEAYDLQHLLEEAYHSGLRDGIEDVFSDVQTALNNAHYRY